MKVTLSRILYQSLSRVEKLKEPINLTPDQFLMLCRDQERLFLSLMPWGALKLPEILDEDWITSFEWAGDNSRYGISKQKFFWISQLIAAFEKNRARYGLLKIIGAFALSGSDCIFATNYLDLKLESPELKRAALLVQTSKGGWSESEAREMATLGCALPEDSIPSSICYAHSKIRVT